MKKSKILIWDKQLPLENMGGPSGYLYNIHEFLKEHPSEQIQFYSDLIMKSETKSQRLDLRDKLKKWGVRFPALIQKLKCLHNHLHRNLYLTTQEIKLLKDFDYVHFHSFIFARAYLRDIRQQCPQLKVILTTHTPEPYCDEYCGTVGIKWLLRLPWVRKYCIKKETDCINNVDYMMFPTPYVKEVYTSHSSLFKQILDNAESKTFYVPTAILDNVIIENKDYLKKFSLGNSLRVCYVGRHNSVKGYDFLKRIAIESWKRQLNISFIIGGNKAGMLPLENERWIELGWVNTMDLLQEVDVFVLPNRQTYYDLILLEVMRAGKPVLLTATGGNKHFLGYKDTGLFFCDYSDTETACQQLEQLSKMKAQGQLAIYGQKNRALFEKTTTMPVYIEKYLKEINKLG